MQSGLHIFYKTNSHCVTVDPITGTQGLDHVPLTKSWSCQRDTAVIRLDINVSCVPMPLVLCSRGW